MTVPSTGTIPEAFWVEIGKTDDIWAICNVVDGHLEHFVRAALTKLGIRWDNPQPPFGSHKQFIRHILRPESRPRVTALFNWHRHERTQNRVDSAPFICTAADRLTLDEVAIIEAHYRLGGYKLDVDRT